MLQKKIICSSCGGEFEMKQYADITVCPYCGREEEFEGFRYKKIDYMSSLYSSYELWSDCPKCRSSNMVYSDDKGCWVCLDCRYEMTQEWLERSTLWFCDKCNTYMNIQSGFSTDSGSWKCKYCCYDNDVTEDNVI